MHLAQQLGGRGPQLVEKECRRIERHQEIQPTFRTCQLELEIDPRIYRKPNSKALAASIITTVRAAVDQAVAKTQEILDRNLPKELREGRAQGMNVSRLIRSHDADLKKTLDEEGDQE
jgi:ketopantoate reductase